MFLELIVSLVLMGICTVSIFNLIANASSMMAYDPMGGIVWPVILCALLVILLAVNSIRVFFQIKGKQIEPPSDSVARERCKLSIKSIIRNKLVIGIATILLYAILLERIGFLCSTPLFIYVYMCLLGQRKVPVKVITALAATFALYFLFSALLQVPLPRGYGLFRNIALAIETLL